MALETAFQDLRAKFDALIEALASLALTAIEDRPPEGAVLPVERLGDAVDEMQGLAQEGRAAAGEARDALADPPDFNLARRALAQAHDSVLRLEQRFFDEAVAHRMVSDLLRFGRQKGGEWQGWSRGVVQALETCRPPLRALDVTLLAAWREIGERLGAGALTVHTHAIGQQTAAPPLASVKPRLRAGAP